MPVTRKKITSPIHRHDPTTGNGILRRNFYKNCGACQIAPYTAKSGRCKANPV